MGTPEIPPEAQGRRSTDTVVALLADKVYVLERRVSDVEFDVKAVRNDLRANTHLTGEIHLKNAEMYLAFDTARNAIKVLTAVGNAVMWGVRKLKEIVIALLISFGFVTLITTGKIPDWLAKLF